MSIRLYPEDCHAIDLLLDQGIRAAGCRSVTSSATAIAHDRLAAVGRVLCLLELMPAPAPPADLVKKTLARVEAAPRSVHGTAPMPGMHAQRGQPSA
jgi:hypothetical protein